jgi:hypothetical protein
VKPAARLERQLRHGEAALRLLGDHRGNVKTAAKAAGLSRGAFRARIATYCELKGYLTLFEAAWHTQNDGEK